MNNKRSIPMIFLLLAFSMLLQAQTIERSVVATQGETFENAGVGSIEWTIGEVLTENADDCILTQGFHQSFIVDGCGFTAAEDIAFDVNLMIFPNPTVEKLNIISQEENIQKVYVFDWSGKLLLSESVEANNQAIVDVKALASAQYVIRVQTENGILNQSFIKID